MTTQIDTLKVACMLHDQDSFGTKFIDRLVTNTGLSVLKDVEKLGKNWLQSMYKGNLEMTAFIPTKDINIWIISYTVMHDNGQETSGYLKFDPIDEKNIVNELV